MATEITMPQLGLTMTEGTIGAWKKSVGDKIALDDVLVEIETDKLTTEINSEVEGVLLAILAREGEEVPVQGIIAYIGQEGEELPAASQSSSAAPEASAASATVQAVQAAGSAAPQAAQGGRVRISPLAKKIAQELELDYSKLAGSGPGGRIIQKDVLVASAQPVTSAVAASASSVVPATGNAIQQESGSRRERMSSMRKVVGERMFKSHSEIPVVTQNVKADVTALMQFRATLNQNRERRFSVNDLVLKALAKALAANPYMLTSIDGNEIVYHERVNLGMAVAIEGGLIVPVIMDADKLSLEALSMKAADLASRARSGQLALEEYQNSTFSMSNLGMFGVESFTPIINQPNAGILGVCSIEDELALVEGQVVLKKVTRLCLTYDHRLLDGAQAAKFQLALKALLENPLEILL